MFSIPISYNSYLFLREPGGGYEPIYRVFVSQRLQTGDRQLDPQGLFESPFFCIRIQNTAYFRRFGTLGMPL